MVFWLIASALLCFALGISMILRSEKEFEYLAKFWLFVVGILVVILGIGIVKCSFEENGDNTSNNPEYILDINYNNYDY